MKIIENNDEYIIANFKIQVRCTKCKTLLEIEWLDIKYESSDMDRAMGFSPEYFYCDCPCEHNVPAGRPTRIQKRVIIPTGLIPSHFKRYIK